MPRRRVATATGATILLIDDSEEYLRATERLLLREGHEVIAVTSAKEGLAVVAIRSVDVILVDYFMPEMTGEDFVVELRKTHPTTHVILQTGYVSECTPRELFGRLDIQGYHDKGEGPEKLLLWVDVGLRAARTLRLAMRLREGLA
jgi:two-component system, cell cycle response regulator